MIKVIFGNEPYLIDFKVNEIVSAAESDFSVNVVNEWKDELVSTLTEPSFFGKPTVIVRAEIPSTQAFIELVEHDTMDYDLVICPTKIDKRTKTYKLLDKHKMLVECNKFATNRVVSFIKQTAKDVIISDETASLLISRLGYYEDDTVNLYTIQIAVLKLCFVEQTEITSKLVTEEIQENITCKIYELFNVLLQGDMKKYFKMYEELSKTENSIGMLSMMLRSARIGYKAALFRDDKKIASAIGVTPVAISFSQKMKASVLSALIDVFQNGINALKSGAPEDLIFSKVSFEAHILLSE